MNFTTPEIAIINRFFKNEILTLFPSKRSKQLLILRFLRTKFTPDITYSERQINEILQRHTNSRDHITLRRDLVDANLLFRNNRGSEYWVIAPEKSEANNDQDK